MTEVRIPIRPGSGSAYEKVERRPGDWAIAAVGCFVTLAEGSVADCGIGLAAVGANGYCAPQAEAQLRGQPATEESFRSAAEAAAASCRPQSDQRGPADYKRDLVRELTQRALRRAAARAMAGGA